MRPAASPRDPGSIWDLAVPSRSGRLAGLSMAGFRQRGAGLLDLQMVPYPAVTLLIDLGPMPLVVDDTSGRQQRGSVAAGLAPRGIRGGGLGIECLQIRLSPVVAHAVLGAPSELTGTVVALDDLWGRGATRTQDQLRAGRSWDDRFATVEAMLARRHEAGRAVNPEIAFAWGQIATRRGQVRVERLAAEIGWSRKRLWSRFRSQIGVTPKRAAQLIRFDHAAHQLASGHSAARAAAESGYADQSHLHREVMALAGVTPTVLASAPWLSVDDVAWPAGHTQQGSASSQVDV